jgi:hypothetical protein
MESKDNEDINDLIETYHTNLNQNVEILDMINIFIGDDEKIIYLLANNFETINLTDAERNINMIIPELLTVFTNKRVLSFKNIKNKAYYRNKNQVPGLERKLHLLDSCTIFKYTKIEQVFIVRNNVSIHYMNSTSIDKNDKGILNIELHDFCFTSIIKLIGNYM